MNTFVNVNALINDIRKLTRNNQQLKAIIAIGAGYILALRAECRKLKAENAELKKVEGE